MSFLLESELLEPVSNWLARRSTISVTEFSPYKGRAVDLVGCLLDKRRSNQRLKSPQSRHLGSLPAVFVYSHLPDFEDKRRGMSLSRLSKALGGTFSDDRIESELAKLIKSNHVVRTKNGTLGRTNGWAPIHKRLLSIELKLSDITVAIQQAVTNKTFTDDSYIAIPMANALRLSRGKRRSQLIDSGVGLIGVSENSAREIISPTTNQSRKLAYLEMYSVEQFWKRFTTAR